MVILDEEPGGKSTLTTPKRRWKESVKWIINRILRVKWIYLAQDRGQW